MTYEESAALMFDTTFRGRIKVALLKYATYLLAEDPNTTAHNSRYKWAQNAIQVPDVVAGQIQPPVVMDSEVQNDGASITDTALQTAVESVINKVI